MIRRCFSKPKGYDAIQFDGTWDSVTAIIARAGTKVTVLSMKFDKINKHVGEICIGTNTNALPGDWILWSDDYSEPMVMGEEEFNRKMDLLEQYKKS